MRKSVKRVIIFRESSDRERDIFDSFFDSFFVLCEKTLTIVVILFLHSSTLIYNKSLCV